MHKLVGTVFKTIMVAVLMIVIFDVAMYIMRVNSLDSKITALSTTLRSEVSKNNYLPSDDTNGTSPYTMYKNMLEDIKQTDPDLVVDYRLYIGHYEGAGASRKFVKDNNDPYNYGETRGIQIRVAVRRVTWGSAQSDGSVRNLDDLEKNFSTTVFEYNYEVPCLRYIK